MSDLAAVEPKWARVIHGEGPDGWLALEIRGLYLNRNGRMLTTYRFTTRRWHKPTEKSSVAHGLAWLVECSLDNGVIAGVEMELDFAAWSDVEGVGLVDETVFADIHSLNAAWR